MGQKERPGTDRERYKKIGFNCSKVYVRRRKHKIKTRYDLIEFENTEYSCKVSSSAFAVLLILLGCPLGNKTEKPYIVPEWILKAPLWQKRLF